MTDEQPQSRQYLTVEDTTSQQPKLFCDVEEELRGILRRLSFTTSLYDEAKRCGYSRSSRTLQRYLSGYNHTTDQLESLLNVVESLLPNKFNTLTEFLDNARSEPPQPERRAPLSLHSTDYRFLSVFQSCESICKFSFGRLHTDPNSEALFVFYHKNDWTRMINVSSVFKEFSDGKRVYPIHYRPYTPRGGAVDPSSLGCMDWTRCVARSVPPIREDHFSAQEIANVNAAITRLTQQLSCNLNVNAVTAECASKLLVYVTDGEVILRGGTPIPTRFEGFSVETKNGGYETYVAPCGICSQACEKYRPLRFGTEIATLRDQERVSFATLGGFVVKGNQICALTAGHLLVSLSEQVANAGVILPKHLGVVQPYTHAMKGPAEEDDEEYGEYEDEDEAEYFYFDNSLPIETLYDPSLGLDVALIPLGDVDNARDLITDQAIPMSNRHCRMVEIKRYGEPSTFERTHPTSVLDDKDMSSGSRNQVYKFGRTTGLTCGCLSKFRVSVRRTLSMIESGSPEGAKHLRGAPFSFSHLKIHDTGAFSLGSPGDSGALVWLDNDPPDGTTTGVGMLLGGLGDDIGIASPLATILQQFGATLPEF